MLRSKRHSTICLYQTQKQYAILHLFLLSINTVAKNNSDDLPTPVPFSYKALTTESDMIGQTDFPLIGNGNL